MDELDRQLAGGHTNRDVAEGIAYDAAREFGRGGAYDHGDPEKLRKRVEEQASRFARSQGLDVDRFVAIAVRELHHHVPAVDPDYGEFGGFG